MGLGVSRESYRRSLGPSFIFLFCPFAKGQLLTGKEFSRISSFAKEEQRVPHFTLRLQVLSCSEGGGHFEGISRERKKKKEKKRGTRSIDLSEALLEACGRGLFPSSFSPKLSSLSRGRLL